MYGRQVGGCQAFWYVGLIEGWLYIPLYICMLPYICTPPMMFLYNLSLIYTIEQFGFPCKSTQTEVYKLNQLCRGILSHLENIRKDKRTKIIPDLTVRLMNTRFLN